MLEAAERSFGRNLEVAVDSDQARLESAAHFVALPLVLGENCAHKAVLYSVGSLNHFVDVREFLHCNDRSENFLLHHFHVISAVDHQGWTQEVALTVDSISAGDHCGTLIFSTLNVH